MLATALALTFALAPLERCPVDPTIGKHDPALADQPASLRTQFIVDRINDNGRRVLRWTLGWGISYGVLSLGQFALAGIAKPDRRSIWIVGGASALAGALSRVALMPRVMKERRRLRKHGLPEGECESLAAAEQALARAARGERIATHVGMHLFVLAFNVSMGLVLGVALDHPIPGIRNAAIGGTLGQIMLVTRPKSMIRTLETYRLGSAPLVLRGGAGLSLTGSF